MHAHHARVVAGGAVGQGVGHDVTVVLLPQPALGGFVGRGDDLQQRRVEVVRRRRAIGRLRRRFDPRAVVERRVVRQGRQRQVAHHLALVLQHDMAGRVGFADHGGVEAPLFEDAIAVLLAARLEDGQHALLRFRQHHLIGRHVLLALRHLVEIERDAEAALARHLDGGRGQARRAHVLNGGDRAGGHQLQRGLDQKLFRERVADLHRGALFLGILGELDRGHGGAVDAVAAGLRAEIDHRQARLRRGGIEDLVRVGQAHAHRVDEDVAVIARVEIRLAADGRHADAVAVAADARHHAFEQAARLRMLRLAEAQRVEQRDRAGAHRKDVAHDAADAGGRALIRLDEGRVVVALHLEDARLPVVDVDHARILAGAADHARAADREFAQVQPRGLVRAMLGPHDREHAQLDIVRLAAEAVEDDAVFLRLEAVLGGLVGHGFLLCGGCAAHARAYRGFKRECQPKMRGQGCGHATSRRKSECCSSSGAIRWFGKPTRAICNPLVRAYFMAGMQSVSPEMRIMRSTLL